MNDKPSRMDYRQHQAARRLVHECCNYDEGNCLLLDDGEPCVCVQSISYSLMCRWFRVAVLPLDGELVAALLYRGCLLYTSSTSTAASSTTRTPCSMNSICSRMRGKCSLSVCPETGLNKI